MRIVSLLPSTTEIIFALGAGNDLVGVTAECDYPAEARTRRVVSLATLPPGLTPAEIDTVVRARMEAGENLYRLDEGALQDLDPDIVITQDLCAVCAVDSSDVSEAMEYLGCTGRVLTIDPSTLSEVIDSILRIGGAIRRSAQAERLVGSLRSRIDQFSRAVAGLARPRVAVVEWTDPPFTAGHWVPDLVTAAGGVSIIGASGQPSIASTWPDIALEQPDVIVIAPCGYGLEGSAKLGIDVVRAGHIPAAVPIWAIDGDSVVVRPGPRLVDGIETLAGTIHPGAVPARSDLVELIRP